MSSQNIIDSLNTHRLAKQYKSFSVTKFSRSFMFVPFLGRKCPYLTPSALRYWVSLNAIPHHYWIIDWSMSLFWLAWRAFILILQWPDLRKFWFFLFARLGPSLLLQWADLRQFWFFTCQTVANSDFSMARLAPILILYLPDWGKFWFFNGQTCANSDFILAKLAPILSFHSEIRQQ